METVACNLCGWHDESLVFSGTDRLVAFDHRFRVVRCRRCRLVYVNPRPTASELTRHYTSDYAAVVREYPHLKPRGLMKAGADMIMRRRVPQGMPPGRALEIGVGGAGYLLALREQGWNVQGIEISAELAQHAREAYSLDVRTGSAESALAQFPDDHFDLVAMWHVVEHLSDPAGVLADIRRVLKPGGRLMMELPNFAGISRHLFTTWWAALDLPRHLYHFTPATMRRMLERAGFEDARVRGVPAALVATISLQLIWNHRRGVQETGLAVSRPLLLAFFPLSAVLARAGLSAHMAAQAVKGRAGRQATQVGR